MKASNRFTLNNESTVLSPGVEGVNVLIDSLRRGTSIVARQSGQHPISSLQSDRQFLFCETAGTSGSAKTIRRRPSTWVRSFDVNQRDFGLGARDLYVTLGHLGHSLSLYATLEALHVGADLLMLFGQSPRRQIKSLVEKQGSVIYATPSQLHLLLAGAQTSGVSGIASVQHIFSGGGKLSDALLGQLLELFPRAAVHEFFGASETSFITIADETTPPGSVGHPYPGVLLEIRDEAPLEPMETGEIWISSPYLFDGYDGAGSSDTRWDEGYLSIGEMGYLDAQGYLFLRGRKNRMVTVADMNVFPEEIEKTIMELPQVNLCAALGIPDDKRGHRILCVIEGQPSEYLEKQMRQKCRKALGAHAVPYRFHFLDKIPRLAAGKPDLQALLRRVKRNA